mmetsp:Transcript_39551/g.63454  ORF Transcript_39551/g.63454 Transcript_39551/m.63454 type:complete len:717 (-) Transcript_39551:141-2291(-)
MDLTLSNAEREHRAHAMRAHYARLKKTRPTIKTRDPRRLERMRRFKKFHNAGKGEKQKKLDDANGKLVNHITEIACRVNRRVPSQRVIAYSEHRRKMADFTRLQRQKKLDRENLKIAQRLLNRTSVYNKKKWKKDFVKFDKMKRHLSKASYYMKDQKKFSVSPPPMLQPLSSELRDSHIRKLESDRFERRSYRPERKRGKSAPPELQPIILEEERNFMRMENKTRCAAATGTNGKKRRSSRSLKICILGPPASGRDIQCERICKKFGVGMISVGEIIDKEMVKRSEFGIKCERYVDERRLIPDKIISQMVLKRLQANTSKGWVVDGFPRTKVQAEEMKKAGISVDLILVLDMGDDVEKVKERVIGRMWDPDTGTMYHDRFYQARDNAVRHRLVRRPQDGEEEVKRALENSVKSLQAALKGPFKNSVRQVSSKARRTDEIFGEVQDVIVSVKKQKRRRSLGGSISEDPDGGLEDSGMMIGSKEASSPSRRKRDVASMERRTKNKESSSSPLTTGEKAAASPGTSISTTIPAGGRAEGKEREERTEKSRDAMESSDSDNKKEKKKKITFAPSVENKAAEPVVNEEGNNAEESLVKEGTELGTELGSELNLSMTDAGEHSLTIGGVSEADAKADGGDEEDYDLSVTEAKSASVLPDTQGKAEQKEEEEEEEDDYEDDDYEDDEDDTDNQHAPKDGLKFESEKGTSHTQNTYTVVEGDLQ